MAEKDDHFNLNFYIQMLLGKKLVFKLLLLKLTTQWHIWWTGMHSALWSPFVLAEWHC